MIYFRVAVLIVGATGCIVQGRVENEAPTFERGFSVFPSPRTFDGPGTVFRLDDSGVRWQVADLSGMLRVERQAERVPLVTVSGRRSAEVLADWLGSIALQADMSGEFAASLALVGSHREFFYESQLRQLIDSVGLLVDWSQPGKIYVIVETVSADSVVMQSERLARLSSADSVGVVGGPMGSVVATWRRASSSSIAARFSVPHRVLFKPKQLVRRTGIEPGDRTTFDLIEPAAEMLVVKDR